MTRMSSDFQDSAPSAPTGPGRRRLRDAQDIQGRRRRYTTIALTVVLFVLLVNSIVGDNGYFTTVRVRAEQQALEGKVAALRLENQRLQEESRRLLTDPSALDELARRTLGFVRPGETLVILHDPAPAPAAPAK